MPSFAALNVVRQVAPATKLALQVLLLASAFLLSPAQTVHAQDTGTAQTEQALKLDREFRAELQMRLKLMGFDPKGTDGVFGPNSRRAISEWQESIDAKPTGYFSSNLMDALILESQPVFDAWSLENPDGVILAKPVVRPKRVVKTCTNYGLFKVCKEK